MQSSSALRLTTLYDILSPLSLPIKKGDTMPRKTTHKTKKSVKVHEMIDTKTENLMPAHPFAARRPMPMAKTALVILVLGLIAIFVSNKGLLVAAIVDGKPIFRWELNRVLVSRFGKQTLEGIISERLIAEESAKAGVSVSQAEIDAKTKTLVDSLGGGMTIDQLLAYQGMTRSDFENQLRLQLTVEKLLGKDIVISNDEVTNYIATNSATLAATDAAGLQEEARQAILSERINEKLQPWFTQLKANAKILRFL
jgi:hypothetical protein